MKLVILLIKSLVCVKVKTKACTWSEKEKAAPNFHHPNKQKIISFGTKTKAENHQTKTLTFLRRPEVPLHDCPPLISKHPTNTCKNMPEIRRESPFAIFSVTFQHPFKWGKKFFFLVLCLSLCLVLIHDRHPPSPCLHVCSFVLFLSPFSPFVISFSFPALIATCTHIRLITVMHESEENGKSPLLYLLI